jgi:RimJ/RimL family protein N-acetyltransferase
MAFELQPSLRNDVVALEPLLPSDFEALYQVASDPLIWEQHPSNTRWQRDVFQNYFEGAIASGGAFRVHDAKTGELVGSSRYYDLAEPTSTSGGSVAIGYTFLARKCWGGAFNRAMKTLMLEHAFRFVDKVVFHVGRDNQRSRAAMLKIGGVLVGEMDIAYHGEKTNPNVVYEITREAWRR